MKLLLLLLGLVLCSNAQKQVVDSVHKSRASQCDTCLIYRYLTLSEAHLMVSPDSTIYFADKAIAESRKHNYRRGEGIAAIDIGMYYADISEYDSALTYFSCAYKLLASKDYKYLGNIHNEQGRLYYSRGDMALAKKEFEQSLRFKFLSKDTLGAAAGYNNLGVICRNMADYQCALDNYFLALKIREKKKDIRGIAQSYTNIAIIYGNLAQHQKSLEYDRKALKIKLDIDDKFGIAKSYNNIASTYAFLNNYDSAIYYNNKAVDIRKTINDKTGLASSYYNLGGAYGKLGQYEKGVNYLKSALEIYLQLKEKSGESLCYLALGSLCRSLKRYNEAAEYFTRALALVNETGTTDQLKDLYSELMILHASAGNYKEAFEWQSKLMQYKDSILNKGNADKLAELEKVYQTEKKELENQNLRKENKLKEAEHANDRLLMISMVAGLVILSVFAFFIFRSLRQNQKANRIITKQKAAAEHQKMMIEEKQKEILDSITYARRIQQALITSERKIQKEMNRLRNKK